MAGHILLHPQGFPSWYGSWVSQSWVQILGSISPPLFGCMTILFNLFFFLRFFNVDHFFFKSSLSLLQHGFYFMFWLFGHGACGILAPRPEIETSTPCTGRQSLNHWTAREVPWLYGFRQVATHLWATHIFSLFKKLFIYLAALVATRGIFVASCRTFSYSARTL